MVDFTSGYRNRTRIDKILWEDYWTNRHGQRRYDEYYNEWDICSEFGEDESRWEELDEEDEFAGVTWLGHSKGGGDIEMSDDSGPSRPLPEPQAYETRISNADTGETALSALVTSSHTADSNRHMSVPDSLQDILSLRYGIHSYSFPSTPLSKLIPPPSAISALGFSRARPESSNYPTLQRFVTDPVRKLVPNDVQHIQPRNSAIHVAVASYSERVWDIFGVAHGACYLIISDQPGDATWQLVVDGATTAGLILRHGWGPSLHAVGEELLKRGIPFHTYIPRPADLIYNDAHHHTSLSWRSVSLGYHYGSTGLAADYCSYVNIRNKFLQSNSGRGALLHGGIVWRLAMDAFGYESALVHALAGPSVDCIDFGGMPQFLADGTELWDDVLSEEELDLVCGVYKASTGESTLLLWRTNT